jgi:outer membrane protein W
MSGLLFNLKIGNNFMIEIDSGNWKSQVKEKNNLYPGELSVTPILVSGIFIYPIKDSLYPYFSIGFGYYFNHFQISEEIITIPEIKINQDIEDSFGFQTGLGIDYIIASTLALNLDVKYCWISPKGETIITYIDDKVNQEIFNLNLNNLLYRICIKIYF